MRGVVAGFLGLALAAALNGGMSWHVHEYEDHDHPEHHHGLAAHHHESDARPEDASLHVEPCDPGQHVVRLTFVCSTARHIDGLNVELATSGSPVLLILLDQTVRLHEVRVHGPPQRTYTPLRAPPSYPRLIN